MRWRPLGMPLYWRLLAWFCAANLLVLVLGGMLAQRYILYATAAQFNWDTLAKHANRAYETGGRSALASWVSEQRAQGVEATLFEGGRPLYPIEVPSKMRTLLPTWLAEHRNLVQQPWPEVRVAIQQVPLPGGGARQLFAIIRGQPHLRHIERERIFLSIDLVLSLLFIGVVGWWVARSVARPVEALRRASQRMANGELSVRVGRHGGSANDELSRLAVDFDAMAERIEALVTHGRRVLQDLSHELRSPLARLRLAFDLARSSDTPAEAAPYLEQAEREIVGLDEMLGQMLDLSRMESGLPGADRRPVDLRDVVRRCIERAHLEAHARALRLQLTSGEPAVISGNAALLEHAVDNLISNALKYSPEGRVVEIGVGPRESSAELTVCDHGPGVLADELPLLFQPFFRGRNARLANGHGLGLAVVNRVVQAHGGHAYARCPSNGGLEIRLEFPLAERCALEPPP